tara:strand:- start:433 stop:624 length:192 start_codon:yes stop_codon:yes gene_type:complete
MKLLVFLIAALLTTSISSCSEGKKSLDGHDMEKPPPSADARRDSEPNFDDLDDPTKQDKPNKW